MSNCSGVKRNQLRSDSDMKQIRNLSRNRRCSIEPNLFEEVDSYHMILIEKTLIYFVIATYLFITLAPLLWVLSTSFKPNQEAISFPPKFLPDSPTFDNYLFVLTDPKLVTSLMNSLAVSLGSTGLSVVVSALGGYAFARFDFKGKNLLISTILGLFIIPVVINIIPLYILLANIGLLNSLLALVLTFQILIIPLNIFLLKNYFETIPKEHGGSGADRWLLKNACFLAYYSTNFYARFSNSSYPVI